MDKQTFGIQWIQDRGDLKTTNGQLIVKPQIPSEDDLALANDENGADRGVYHLVTGNDDDGGIPNEVDIDQIAAENLIFMARDGQMVAEIIDASTDDNGTVVTSDEIDCSEVLQQTGNGFIESFVDTTPQMVTEEVITDDWVQHQGEER